MSLRTKFNVAFIVSALLALFGSGVLLQLRRDMSHALERDRVAVKIVEAALNLTLVANDFAVYGDERPRQQWSISYGNALQLLATAEALFREPDDRDILARIGFDHSAAGELFEQLAPAAESTGDRAVPPELRARLASQLAVRLQQAAAGSLELAARTRSRLARAQTRTTRLVVSALVVMVAIIGGLLALVLAGVVRPIRRLRASTEIVGSGRLDHRVGLTARDEIGELARAFDTMTQRLRDLTVSRSELEAEVARTTRAQLLLQQRTDELERSNAELEQFAYVASHDLQEPLRSMTGFAGFLRRRCQGRLGSDGERYLERIVAAAARMQKLILDLLQYSRVGRDGASSTPVDVEEIVAQEIANLERTIRESGATVTHGDLPTVHVDPALLAQLLRNLIGNALKFHSRQPPEVAISCRRREDEWEFAVRDNGIGIQPEHADRIFDIFKRLHTRAEYSGTGIGLAVCKKAAERMGGRIWVESEPDAGATFFFTVPRPDAAFRHTPRQEGGRGDD